MAVDPRPYYTAAQALAAQAKPDPQSFEEMEAERIAELREAQAPFGRLVRCYEEATLFISTEGRAMIGWRWNVGGRIKVFYESGFRAFPSESASSAASDS